MKSVNLVCSIILLATISCRTDEKTIDATLRYSYEWLWTQQGKDGGWHSQTHAVLRDGRVLTPYILFHLLQSGDNYPGYHYHHSKFIDRAVEFINREMRSSFDEDSVTLIDYPNYSAAYALRVLYKLNRDTLLQRIIANYLLDQQFTEHRGFTPDSLAYGGWGYGEPDLPFGQHGHIDISHTRRITEALVETGYLKNFESVKLFLKGVQRTHDDKRLYEGCITRTKIPYDGGFVASVVTLSTVKSEPTYIDSGGYHYPSYATATCDGFLTMHMLGMQETKEYGDAKRWLEENQHYTTIDGLTDHPEQWDQIMHYYHLAVRSEAMSIIDPKGEWKTKIATIIKNEMQDEGFFINPIGGVNKEDDPLMATILAVQAGSQCRR